jgi:hypothetical protein
MTNDVGAKLGHEGNKHVRIGAQSIHQIGFLCSSEGGSVNRPDRGTLVRAVAVFNTNADGRVHL